LIDLICEDFRCRKYDLQEVQHKLIITVSSDIPVEIHRNNIMDRVDLQTTHEEADVIIPRQVMQAIEEGAVCVKVICDDTDVFVLLLHVYLTMNLTCTVLMESTSAYRTIVDIGATTQKNKAIIPSLLAAHALSGCDTVARLTGIGKIKVIKQLVKGLHLDHLGVKDASFDLVLSEATSFIAACYGSYNKASMSDDRYEVWLSKIGKKNIICQNYKHSHQQLSLS